VTLSMCKGGINHRELFGTCRGGMTNPAAGNPVFVSGWIVCGHSEMTIHDLFLSEKSSLKTTV
jgi:hypothetical protein